MTQLKFMKFMFTRKERSAAHHKVSAAVMNGDLVPAERCQKCHRLGGDRYNRLQAHHHKGYSVQHQLTVRWLCRRCHLRAHGKRPRAASKPIFLSNGLYLCPECQSRTRVIDSRPISTGVRRRRRCASGHAFTTYERSLHQAAPALPVSVPPALVVAFREAVAQFAGMPRRDILRMS